MPPVAEKKETGRSIFTDAARGQGEYFSCRKFARQDDSCLGSEKGVWNCDFRVPDTFFGLAAHLLELETLVMPNDAKLGLVVGVGLVIAVAVVFSRKDPEAATSQTAAVAAPAASVADPCPPVASRGQSRPTQAKVAARTEPVSQAIPPKV